MILSLLALTACGTDNNEPEVQPRVFIDSKRVELSSPRYVSLRGDGFDGCSFDFKAGEQEADVIDGHEFREVELYNQPYRIRQSIEGGTIRQVLIFADHLDVYIQCK